MIAALLWTYGSMFRRVVGGRRIQPVAARGRGRDDAHDHRAQSGTFLYFPADRDDGRPRFVFLGSLLFERPMIARMASDFARWMTISACRDRAPIGLTLMWAGVHLLSALTMFMLLVSLPTPTFVALKGVVSLVITVTAIVFTVTWSIRTARREDLIFAPVTRVH
jgi:hypothetical protein